MHNQFMDEAARRQYREADALGTCMHALSELDEESRLRVRYQLLVWVDSLKEEAPKIDMRSARKEPYRCGDAYEVPGIPE